MGKLDLRLCPPATIAELRRRVVRLAATGASRIAIARRLGLRPATITSWLQTYRARGQPGLATLARGRPPAPRLPPEQLLRLLLRPPSNAWLWTTRSAAARISTHVHEQLSPRRLLRMLGTAGLLPLPHGVWTEQAEIQDVLAEHRCRQPYLATATTLTGELWGWAFNLIDTTGRHAFLFSQGPLRIAEWIAFLERARKHIGERAAVLLMQPPWLCERPSVQRWLGQQRGGIIAVGIEVQPAR